MANADSDICLYLTVGWDKITGRLKKQSQARIRAKELTNLLVELGPAFVKAGQALSTRPDIIPGVLLKNYLNYRINYQDLMEIRLWN